MYHTLYKERRKKWDEIPYQVIAKKIKRKDYTIGDFGAGENLLRLEPPLNKIEAFDHIAIDDSVISCDISNVPVVDDHFDAVVLCLALMGSNYKDYIKEAYRTLKYDQWLYLAEPVKRWEGKIDQLITLIESYGFKCLQPDIRSKFFYIEAVKK